MSAAGNSSENAVAGVPEDLLTGDEVARRLKVSRRTVRRLVTAGLLRQVPVGHLVRFTEAEVRRYVAENTK